MQHDDRPLVLHVMHRFDVGGLENGVVNLINHMPADRYRHAVLALTEVTEFRQRVERRDVDFFSLHKPPGQGVWQFPKLFKLFRELRPTVVHSRNLAALEVQLPAWAAGVPVRIHGEHGRDIGDLEGANLTYQRVRRFYKPFVHHYMALSRDLAAYLEQKVRVVQADITQACNGVDTERFFPPGEGARPIDGCPFDPARHWLIGAVGRMQPVKDPVMLAQAFVLALARAPEQRERLRLVMVGDGPMRAQVQAVLEAAGVAQLAWLPGERNDVASIMRGLHVFVLPSLAEGISNTILEAMASGLPVIATAVGGNADLVLHGATGYLVPASDPTHLATHLLELELNRAQAWRMGELGRQRVLATFSMQAMVSLYQRVYAAQLSAHAPPVQHH